MPSKNLNLVKLLTLLASNRASMNLNIRVLKEKFIEVESQDIEAHRQKAKLAKNKKNNKAKAVALPIEAVDQELLKKKCKGNSNKANKLKALHQN